MSAGSVFGFDRMTVAYVTRSGEEQSFLVIRKIETLPKVGQVTHVSVFGLKVKAAHAPEPILTYVPRQTVHVKRR